MPLRIKRSMLLSLRIKKIVNKHQTSLLYLSVLFNNFILFLLSLNSDIFKFLFPLSDHPDGQDVEIADGRFQLYCFLLLLGT